MDNFSDDLASSQEGVVDSVQASSIYADPHMEQCVLGCLLQGREHWDDVRSALTEHDFSIADHRQLYRVLNDLYLQELQVDVASINNATAQVAVSITQPEKLYQQCMDAPVSTDNLSTYLQLLRTVTLRRILRASGENILKTSQSKIEASSVVDLANRANEDFAPVTDFTAGAHSNVDMQDMVESFLETAEKIKNEEQEQEVTVGLSELDEKLHALKAGQLIIVAARPGVGKTTFAMQVILHNLKQKIRSMMFSLEMSSSEIMSRFICAYHEKSNHNGDSAVMFNLLTAQQKPEFLNKLEEMKQWPFALDDSTQLTEADVSMKVRNEKKKHPDLKLIVIDYVTLMRSSSKYDRADLEVAQISRELKQLARREKVAIILISQLNRQGPREVPGLHMLRESGSLEQDADAVLLLYDPSKLESGNNQNLSQQYEEDSERVEKDEIVIKLAKNRNGPTGEETYTYDKELFTFKERNKQDIYAAAPATNF